MIKLSEEEKTKLKSVGLDDSDITNIDEAILSIVKRNWIIYSIVGLIVGYIIGRLC